MGGAGKEVKGKCRGLQRWKIEKLHVCGVCVCVTEREAKC